MQAKEKKWHRSDRTFLLNIANKYQVLPNIESLFF